jgi:L-rhamnonate dehydratase
MDLSFMGKHDKIEKIERATLPGKRFRASGKNSSSHEQGDSVTHDIVRITIAGRTGFGWSVLTQEAAHSLIGKSATQLFTPEGRVHPEYAIIDYPLLDWLGQALSSPIYSLFGKKAIASSGKTFSAACYDTSLYFDEIHLEDEKEAVQFMQKEVAEGLEKGHRNFKIKIGRGGRHMPLEAGTQRDIAVIRGVREAAGPEAKIMIDANNAYNLNIAKQVLSAVAKEKVFWLEEAFFENPLLYEDLKEWMSKQGMNVLVADGEGHAASTLVEWALQGHIDVIQYDILTYGFSRWLELGQILDKGKIKTAPHNYHSGYGNYVSCHLAAAIEGFLFVEWDEIDVTGLDASGYKIAEGKAIVPSDPGFGLKLDDGYFTAMVKENGWIAGNE